MDNDLLEKLKNKIKGEVLQDSETLNTYSHDASLFEIPPKVVIFPQEDQDVINTVKFVAENKKAHPELSVTARSAGTDMGGGPLNESIILSFTQHMNKIIGLEGNTATTQPGVFYRDFEKYTLQKGLIFPSYPASRELCAMGGIVNNNSGGEKSLQYGKTEKYVKNLKVVLSDGNVYELKALSDEELKKKLEQKNFEGELYNKMYKLITENYDKIKAAKPTVSKNSAGYYLWNVYDKDKKVFDLTQVFVGAQGTLGMLLQAELELVPVHKHREMVIIYLKDMSHLGQIIDTVLPLKPESFESYDDNTLMLALKYFPEFARQLGPFGMVEAGLAFMPAFLQMLTGHLPKLILQVDFTGDYPDELKQKVKSLREKLKPLHPLTKVSVDDQEKKYWLVRRESFNLLRKKIRDKHTAPFIDDFVINPHDIATVIPMITDILKPHPEFIFTVAGHVGDGNFHIIPLVDIKNPKVRELIPEISKKVYAIINQYHGSITGEHNDGLIRSPYLEQMYGEDIYKLFEKTKEIFDPEGIFNPRKKVGSSMDYAMKHLRTNW
ncbi:FAD-binding oxidoreductase [Patescibacteria group bacterium]|nr:FAD-binding oxidoreductase [Patescibacteria group bacterium]